jgi:hypothetical protein
MFVQCRSHHFRFLSLPILPVEHRNNDGEDKCETQRVLCATKHDHCPDVIASVLKYWFSDCLLY